MARILKDVPQLAFAYFNFELTLCVLKVRNYTVHLLKLDGRMHSSFCIGKVGLCLFFGRQFLATSVKGTEYLISLSTSMNQTRANNAVKTIEAFIIDG